MTNESISIEDLLPHGKPMVLLDKLESWKKGFVETRLTIRKTSLFFVEGKGVPTYVGLEYMAQTCGVYAGLEARAQGAAPRLGFLLGTRQFHATSPWFCCGEELILTAEEVLRQDGMGVFDCKIRVGETEKALAQLNLYQPEDSEALLQRLKE